MNTHRWSLFLAGCFTAAVATAAPAETVRKPMRAADEASLEVQARGPVHEAFAQLAPTNPDPGPVIPRQPPKSVAELPPEQKPDNEQVQWIPGYWSWDTDRKDFVWVSGTWRAAPAERQWVPGHWSKTTDGWQWAPGFWAETQQRELDYVPRPPDSQDRGPSAPAPNVNSFYVPGCWLPLDGRFVWRPGFWSACRAGRVWIPSRYAWTPGGYVFLNGYWDYGLEGRGLLFAPVYFSKPLYSDPMYGYQPNYVVGMGPLLDCLFARPGYGSYYFGDYFGDRYEGLGFAAWPAYGGRAFDPLYRYYSWSHRGDPSWQRGLQASYANRAAGRLTLPPRTLAAQTALLQSNSLARTADRSSLQVVRPLGSVTGVRLVGVTGDQLSRQQARIQGYQNLSAARGRIETPNQFTTRGPAAAPAQSIASLKLSSASTRGSTGQTLAGPRGSSATVRYYYPNGIPRSTGPVIRGPATGRGIGPSTMRSSPSYRAGPSYRPGPTFRSSPSYRGGSSYRSGGSHHGGGGHGGGHGGGGHHK
jgi:hypothetical protein